MVGKRLRKIRWWLKKHRKEAVGFVLGVIFSALLVEGYVLIEQNQIAMPYKKQSAAPAWLPETVTRFRPEIEVQAAKYNLDASFVMIIMTLESGGFTRADSGFARGLMQVTPSTAAEIAQKHLKTPVATYDLFDPKTSIEFGVAYLAYLRNTYCDGGDGPTWDTCAEVIAAGYNGGPSAAVRVVEGKGIEIAETLYYSRNAYGLWRERHAEKSPTLERWKAAGGRRLIDQAMKES